MAFLEDQSQPLPSPLSLDGVTGTKIFHAAGDDVEALRRRRGLSVTDVEHFKPSLCFCVASTAYLRRSYAVDADPYGVAWRAPPKNPNYASRWRGPQALWLVRCERTGDLMSCLKSTDWYMKIDCEFSRKKDSNPKLWSFVVYSLYVYIYIVKCVCVVLFDCTLQWFFMLLCLYGNSLI